LFNFPVQYAGWLAGLGIPIQAINTVQGLHHFHPYISSADHLRLIDFNG
jgi:hypothetical protein